MERISVALATYNGAEFLKEQLDSIAAQQLLPEELVVTDDCSTDQTIQILQRFAADASFDVKIVQNDERLGYRNNFRKAAALCSGSLIAFCDQDDVWHPDKLKQLAAAFSDPSVFLAYHNAYVTERDGSRVRLMLSDSQESAHASVRPLKPFKFSNGLLQMFRADLRRYDDLWGLSVDENVGDLPLAHDQWYFFLAQLLGRVAYIPLPLIDYRQHGKNTCGVLVQRTWLEDLSERLEHYADKDLFLIQSASGRASVARELALREPDRRTHLLNVAELYERFDRRLHRRYQVYAAPSWPSRTRSLLRSVVRLDYGRKPWRFDARTLARDLWSGVVHGRLSRS